MLKGPLPVPKFAGGMNLTGVQIDGVLTVSTNVSVAVGPPPLNARTKTVYVPAGCASVMRTTPVAGFAESVPLKSVEVETLMLVVFVGAVSGTTAVLVLSSIEVSG